MLAFFIESSLAGLGSPEQAAGAKAYLKSDLVHLGVPIPGMRLIVKAVHKQLGKEDRWPLVEELWNRGIYEHRWMAAELLVLGARTLTVNDLPRLERLLRNSHTWALVDTLAPAVVGSIYQRDPAAGPTLDRWSTDPDFWLRRSAMLALLVPLRKGGGDWPRFCRYADAMLEDKQFFIRKAIGWILREVARKRPELVYDWMYPRMSRFSGVTLREGLRALPKERQEALLAERGDGQGGRKVRYPLDLQVRPDVVWRGA